MFFSETAVWVHHMHHRFRLNVQNSFIAQIWRPIPQYLGDSSQDLVQWLGSPPHLYAIWRGQKTRSLGDYSNTMVICHLQVLYNWDDPPSRAEAAHPKQKSLPAAKRIGRSEGQSWRSTRGLRDVGLFPALTKISKTPRIRGRNPPRVNQPVWIAGVYT